MSQVDAMLMRRIMTVVSRTEESFKRLKRNAAAIAKLEELTGKSFCTSEYDVDTPYFEIKREELPLIRKAVGRLSVIRKEVAWDYDTSNEIEVYIMPSSKDFDFITFRYRSKLRPSAKCKVVETKSTHRALVCEK